MANNKYTREEIKQALKEIAAEGKQPSTAALKRRGISGYWIRELFPEGMTALKKEMGLKLSHQEQPHTDEELLKKIDAVVSKLKRIPVWIQLRRETRITDKVFKSHFGKKGKDDVYTHYRDWLKKHQPRSGNIKLVDAYLEGKETTFSPESQVGKRIKGAANTKWEKVSGRVYGGHLHFGNLVYEPSNEQGVVFLFGMISKRLGFSVEGIGIEYPDCEAKRNIGKGRQQHVRIEFEYRSRDFDHDPKGCDLIVCWEDNWGKNCPKPVIELKKEIKALRDLPEFRPE
jgi:hypothetical protein